MSGRYAATQTRRGRRWSSGERAALDLPIEGARLGGKIMVRHGEVADPNSALRGARQRVAINCRHDSLEMEYSAQRISRAAYLAGRGFGAVLERARGRTGGGQGYEPRERVDRAAAHEAAILMRLETAQEAVDMEHDVRAAVGWSAALLLEGVLLHGLAFGALAAEGGWRARRETGAAFRAALEALATHWARRGVLGCVIEG